MKNKILKILYSVMLITSCFIIMCNKKTFVVNPNEERGIITAIITNNEITCRANVINIFENSIIYDTLNTYYNLNDLISKLPSQRELSLSFIQNNAIEKKHLLNALPAKYVILKKPFYSAEDIINFDNKNVRINYPSSDTLKNLYMRISRPGLDKNNESAIVYIEVYIPFKENYGQLLILKRDLVYWKITDIISLWAYQKYKKKGVFISYSTKNIEEDTTTYRTNEEIETYSKNVMISIENKYKSTYTDNKPSGAIQVEAYVNCAGDVLKVKIERSEIIDVDFLKYIMNEIYNIKFADNLRTNKCGDVLVSYIFTWKN